MQARDHGWQMDAPSNRPVPGHSRGRLCHKDPAEGGTPEAVRCRVPPPCGTKHHRSRSRLPPCVTGCVVYIAVTGLGGLWPAPNRPIAASLISICFRKCVTCKQPRQLGFTLACQTVLSSWMLLSTGVCRDARSLWEHALARIAANEVANRPGRIEPRVLKRRRHGYPLMQHPRRELREKLLKT